LEKTKYRRSRISFDVVVISLKYTAVFIMAEAEQRLQHDPAQFDESRVSKPLFTLGHPAATRCVGRD
jgi:hypothetical protein